MGSRRASSERSRGFLDCLLLQQFRLHIQGQAGQGPAGERGTGGSEHSGGKGPEARGPGFGLTPRLIDATTGPTSLSEKDDQTSKTFFPSKIKSPREILTALRVKLGSGNRNAYGKRHRESRRHTSSTCRLMTSSGHSTRKHDSDETGV